MASRRRYGPRPPQARQGPPPQEARPPSRPAPARPKPVSQPFPVPVVFACLFVVFIFCGIALEYYSISQPELMNAAYSSLVVGLICVAAAFYTAFTFHGEHRTDFPARTKLATFATIGILMGGTIAGVVTFALLEPYNEWSYTARLHCDGSCVADLPVPVRTPGSNATFFTPMEANTTGQGYIEIVQQFSESGQVPSLRVHWSGNFVIKAGTGKDYRDLRNGKNGLYNSTRGDFIVIGELVPFGANATVRVELEHKYVSQAPRSDHWVIQGPLVQGENSYHPEKP